jgi:hypothetical protein
MGVVTISRGTKSGGILLAEGIGERLGAKVLSRTMLLDENPRLRKMEDELWEELNQRPPYLYDTLEPLRQAYLCGMRATLVGHAVHGPIVYHANGGQLLLHDVPGLLRVRVVAPMGKRLHFVMARRGGNELEASNYIHQKDENRTKWNRFLYGVKSLDDSLHYDVVINLEHMDPSQAADMVAMAAELPRFKWNDTHPQQIADLALATRVKSALMQDPNVRLFRLEVQATDGTVTILREMGDEAIRGEIEAIVRTTAGVKSVTIVPGE